MSSGSKVHVTHNFAENLEGIKQFLMEQDAPRAFGQLLQQIFDRVIPNLCRFPELGTSFLARQPASVEGEARRQALERRLGGSASLREYITGEYLLLYAVRGGDIHEIYLLSIKHHRQLSYDLKRFHTLP